MNRTFKDNLSRVLLLTPFIGIMVLHQAYLFPYTVDDAYIFGRYAQNLASGHGWVFNVGERVVGFSSFIFVTLLGALVKIGWRDPILDAKLVGALAAIGVLIVLLKLNELISKGRDPKAGLFSVFLLITSSPFVLWSVAGLETGLYTLLLALAIYLYLWENDTRRFGGAFAGFALVAMSRPEGIFIFFIALLHRLWLRIQTRSLELHREDILDVLSFSIPFGIFVIWRFLYMEISCRTPITPKRQALLRIG